MAGKTSKSEIHSTEERTHASHWSLSLSRFPQIHPTERRRGEPTPATRWASSTWGGGPISKNPNHGGATVGVLDDAHSGRRERAWPRQDKRRPYPSKFIVDFACDSAWCVCNVGWVSAYVCSSPCSFQVHRWFCLRFCLKCVCVCSSPCSSSHLIVGFFAWCIYVGRGFVVSVLRDHRLGTSISGWRLVHTVCWWLVDQV